MNLIKSIYSILFAGIILSTIFSSCKKEKEIVKVIETEYVTISDTIVITDTFNIVETISDTLTTFILSRHAETIATGTDPVLSSLGLARTNELKRILENVSLSAVLSSNYNRTRQTADSVSVAHSLTTELYDAFNIENVVDQTLLNYKDKVVYIVGHSNTTPEMLNILTGTNDYADIPETDYDNLYIVSISKKGKSKVTHLKYGN